MMLTIHGLPPKIKFQDVKLLIRQECNINEFILDNLVTDDNGCKKIRVGLADGDEGHVLMKCLDRFRMPGNFVLTVVPVGKLASNAAPLNTFDSRPDFQTRGDKQRPEYLGNQPKEYHGAPRGDYPSNKPRMDQPGSQRNDYPVNQVRSDFHSKSRNEMAGDFHGNKPREIPNQLGNQSRDYQGVKPRVEFQRNQGRGDYPGNQRDFQTRSDYQAQKDDFNKPRDFQGNSPRDFPGNQPRDYQGNSYSNQAPTGLNVDRPSPWGGNVASNTNQWGAPVSAQVPQNTFGYQQPGPPVQSFGQQQPVPANRAEVRPLPARVPPQDPPHPTFGFQPKNADAHRLGRNDSRSHVLRSVEITDSPLNPPAQQARYPLTTPYQADKPVTIMKDNFQGPSQYAVGSAQPQYHSPGQTTQPWGQPGQPTKPFAKSSPVQFEKPYHDERKYPTDRPIMKGPESRITETYPDKGRFSPPHGRRHSPDRHFSPTSRRLSSPVRRMSPSSRDIPLGRRMSPSSRDIPIVRRISPSSRDIPAGRRMSPSSRNIAAGRRMSPSGRDLPTGRRMSPSSRDIPSPRRLSPSGRDIPVGRRMSPSNRDIPAGRRLSPSGRDIPLGRRMSPSGRDIPMGRRMSPSGRDIPVGRRMSPSGRDVPVGRRMSPSGRDIPVGRRMSPSGRDIPVGRRMSPSGRDIPTARRMSPSERDIPVGRNVVAGRNLVPGRPISPDGRRMSPSRRRMSPSGRRISPSRRLISPVGRVSPGRSAAKGRDVPAIGRRMSPPGRRMSPMDSRRQLVSPPRRAEPRPSPPRQHQRYSPGRHSDKQPDKYGDTKLKQVRPAYEPPTQAAQGMYSGGYRGEAGGFPRDSWHREERDEPRRSHHSHPSPRKSRSPTRFKKHSPARFKRHSPSPRSPGRFKRQSPSPHSPRRSWALEKRASPAAPPPPLWPGSHERQPVWDRPAPDPDFPDFDRRPHAPRDKDDFRDDRRRDEPNLPLRKEIDRDFNDVYRKALEFKKRAEELRSKSGERRREYQEDRRGGDDDRWRRDEPEPKRLALNPPRNTRDKAVEELATKILVKHADCDSLTTEQKLRLKEELKLAISRRVTEMFGNQEVTFIEIIIKYQGRFDQRDEQRLLSEVMASLPSHYRATKRPAPESTAVPAKSSRWSADTETKPDGTASKLSSGALNWTVNIDPPKLVSLPLMPMAQLQQMQQLQSPLMVPAPFMHPPMHHNMVFQPEPPPDTSDDGYNLYLCKDDFEPFTDNQADFLKDFLVSQIIKVTETSQGWAPDLTLKGLQSQLRYEVSTRDDESREWLQKLDFSELENTHIFSGILVYTKEELWYERAAVWLPGHSRSRNIEPLEKLRLQNKHLTDVNVGKWKFVRKIVLPKGTRLYVDMPPSCARALEEHKMMLSFELQKVNVFLKAVAVDKDSFDAGLKEFSIAEPTELIKAIQNSPVPSLPYDPSVIKITLKGCKNMTIVQARKIKEIIVYHLFKYHQQGGKSKTDFLKYGYVPPSYFGIVPENNESKRWILGQHLGKMNRHPIVILGGDDEHTRYFRMVSTQLPIFGSSDLHQPALVMERLKHSNQGVKGINFNLWNPLKLIQGSDRYRCRLEVDIDLDSVEALFKMNFMLDYDAKHGHTTKQVVFRSDKYSEKELKDKIAKYKAEMTDTYDNANMDLESSDDDLICLD